jgi:hypothetical protein
MLTVSDEEKFECRSFFESVSHLLQTTTTYSEKAVAAVQPHGFCDGFCLMEEEFAYVCSWTTLGIPHLLSCHFLLCGICGKHRFTRN